MTRDALQRIEISDDLDIGQERIADGYSCVIVDNFLKDPQQVVSFACRHASAFSIPPRSYPGMILELGTPPMTDIYRFIRAKMSKTFSFSRAGMNLSTLLSMVTLQPAELSNLQRLCHTDPRSGVGRENLAALVYLFHNEDLGGTAFYRWRDRKTIERATALDLEDPDAALAFLSQRFATYNEPAQYITRSNEIVELVGMIPAKFNRLIFYRGDLPHSAYIESPDLLSQDPALGRLTLNCFANVRSLT